MASEIKVFIVLWDNEAKMQLKAIHDHIKYQSEKNALLVVDSILETARSLKTMPERYEVYEPMKNIPGNYRFKEVSSYLLIYDVTDTEVHVVRVAHKHQGN